MTEREKFEKKFPRNTQMMWLVWQASAQAKDVEIQRLTVALNDMAMWNCIKDTCKTQIAKVEKNAIVDVKK